MLQSSITAWLKKPASVKRADTPVESPGALVALPSSPLENPPTLPESALPEVVTPDHNASTDHPPISDAFALKPLPANVELVPLTEELVPSFKRLNSLTLPIAYPPTFYTETMTEPHHSVTLMALWRSEPLTGNPYGEEEKPLLIGAIRCRILPSSNLYISTIGLLSPYRSHGIATHLLHRIAVKAAKENGIKCITAHVWEANEDGLEWYKKRGFEVIGKENGYYRKLKPSGAFLVRKWIGVGDFLGDADAFNANTTR